MLKELGKEVLGTVENWKEVNNQYFELSKTGIIQPYEYVLKVLNNQKNLFFIDIGAHDGLSCSNSAYMEFFLDWNGICIEPHTGLFNLLTESRSCKSYNCCVSDASGYVDFVTIEGNADALSGIKDNMTSDHMNRVNSEVDKFGGNIKTEKIKSMTLNEIMSENNIQKVDYLSIDTEGSELKILNSIDFDKFDINVISAENNGYDDSVRLFLESKGYRFLTKCCADEIFIKN